MKIGRKSRPAPPRVIIVVVVIVIVVIVIVVVVIIIVIIVVIIIDSRYNPAATPFAAGERKAQGGGEGGERERDREIASNTYQQIKKPTTSYKMISIKHNNL